MYKISKKNIYETSANFRVSEMFLQRFYNINSKVKQCLKVNVILYGWKKTPQIHFLFNTKAISDLKILVFSKYTWVLDRQLKNKKE